MRFFAIFPRIVVAPDDGAFDHRHNGELSASGPASQWWSGASSAGEEKGWPDSSRKSGGSQCQRQDRMKTVFIISIGWRSSWKRLFSGIVFEPCSQKLRHVAYCPILKGNDIGCLQLVGPINVRYFLDKRVDGAAWENGLDAAGFFTRPAINAFWIRIQRAFLSRRYFEAEGDRYGWRSASTADYGFEVLTDIERQNLESPVVEFGEDQDRATFATRLQPKEFNQLVRSGNGFTGATMNS